MLVNETQKAELRGGQNPLMAPSVVLTLRKPRRVRQPKLWWRKGGAARTLILFTQQASFRETASAAEVTALASERCATVPVTRLQPSSVGCTRSCVRLTFAFT